jgi:hypothetical protein
LTTAKATNPCAFLDLWTAVFFFSSNGRFLVGRVPLSQRMPARPEQRRPDADRGQRRGLPAVCQVRFISLANSLKNLNQNLL